MKRLLLSSLLLGLIPPANAADTCNFVSEYYSDVTIEIINGEPRRTFKDQVAKYDYIISQAKGNTSAELESSFQGEDEKILSIWGGTKVSKKMDVEGECKYVYVVIRIANDLNFQNATVTDDRGREVNIP